MSTPALSNFCLILTIDVFGQVQDKRSNNFSAGRDMEMIECNVVIWASWNLEKCDSPYTLVNLHLETLIHYFLSYLFLKFSYILGVFFFYKKTLFLYYAFNRVGRSLISICVAFCSCFGIWVFNDIGLIFLISVRKVFI